MTESYYDPASLPKSFEVYAGPKGPALVRAWPDGRTDKGWGLNPPPYEADGFMPRYLRGEFNARRVVYGFEKGKWAFAFVMRSVQLVCIDIDGKNGGFTHAKKLGALPTTMAETSKSGNGYHLFYLLEEEWDDDLGYGSLGDRIGIEQGVDVRVTGCVYHHDSQRWNNRLPAPMPQHLIDQLKHREQKLAATTQRIAAVLGGDDQMEVLMLQDEIVSKLSRPIAPGKRNTTLFAIGSEMKQAEVPGWEQLLADRATQVGLDLGEAEKIISNIDRYALTQQP